MIESIERHVTRLHATEFHSLVKSLQERSLTFCSVSDLRTYATKGLGASFRYDIHVRDIAKAHDFAQEHASAKIPGTFFLQIDYSVIERAQAGKFVELAQFVRESGLEVGLHPSPVDSYLIWSRFGGESRQYANWLRNEGAGYIDYLCEDKLHRESLNREVEEHFRDLVTRARSLIGPFSLVASHGGELNQILRPKRESMSPQWGEVLGALLAPGWLTPKRLLPLGLTGDAQQFLTTALRQCTDRGGGYRLMEDSLARIRRDLSLQVLIHPYGWGGVKAPVAPIGKHRVQGQEAIIETLPSDCDGPLLPASNVKESTAMKESAPKILQGITILDLKAADDQCKSACKRVHEKWETWFRKTFKNTEKTVDGEVYSVPGIPLAVIDARQTEAEYLKLIGDKSRNMLRKAAKNGYTVKSFESKDYLSDIYSIRNSKEFRSGKPIPESFRQPPAPFDSANDRLCSRHQVTGVGVFGGDGALVSYAAVHNCGDIAIINTILGHGDHLKYGIMNLLVFGIFTEVSSKYPDVKYINYLTLRSSTPQLDTFKKSVGFVPQTLCVRVGAVPDADARNPIASTWASGVSKEREQHALAHDLRSHQLNRQVQRDSTSDQNPISKMIAAKSFRKILIRGDCCSIRTVARNPELFGKPEIIQNEKCTMQVYLDHLEGVSYSDELLASLCDLDAMAPSLRRYYVNQNKASILRERDADLLVIDSYADSFFQLWQHKQSKAKLWVNAKFLRDRATFEREHVKLPRRTFNEVLVDTKRFIEHVRKNNADLPVLYLTHPIHYYRFLNSRREFCYLGEELERFVPNVYWGTHLPKEECDPVDMDSCGPGETHHYTPETYAKMVLAAANRAPIRTSAEVLW